MYFSKNTVVPKAKSKKRNANEQSLSFEQKFVIKPGLKVSITLEGKKVPKESRRSAPCTRTNTGKNQARCACNLVYFCMFGVSKSGRDLRARITNAPGVHY